MGGAQGAAGGAGASAAARGGSAGEAPPFGSSARGGPAGPGGGRGDAPFPSPPAGDARTGGLSQAVDGLREMMHSGRFAAQDVVEIGARRSGLARSVCSDADLLAKIRDPSVQLRDIGLLTAGRARGGDLAFVVRRETMLLKLFEVKALVTSDTCLLLDGGRPHVEEVALAIQRSVLRGTSGPPPPRDGAADRGAPAPPQSALPREAAAAGGPGGAVDGASAPSAGVLASSAREEPFELRAVDALMAMSIERLYHSTGQLGILVDVVLRDLEDDPDQEGLRKIIPLKQRVESLRQQARAMDALVTKVLDDDEEMAAMNLTWVRDHRGQTPPLGLHVEVEAVLESARREVQTIRRELAEINERIDDNREVVNISLDSQRNRLLRTNLEISIAALAIAAMNLPAAALGMNVPTGLEESGSAFGSVLMGMGFAATSIYAFTALYRVGFMDSHAQKIKEHRALVRVLGSMDDVERVFYSIASKEGVSPREFREALNAATGKRFTEEDMALISRAYDDDGDAQLQLNTYRRIVDMRRRREGASLSAAEEAGGAGAAGTGPPAEAGARARPK